MGYTMAEKIIQTIIDGTLDTSQELLKKVTTKQEILSDSVLLTCGMDILLKITPSKFTLSNLWKSKMREKTRINFTWTANSHLVLLDCSLTKIQIE